MRSIEKKRKRRRKVLLLFLFLIGFALLAFPFVSQYLHARAAQVEVTTYQRQVQELEVEEIDQRIVLAEAYNETLDPARMGDPWNKAQEQGREHYASMLEVHEKIAYLEIPRLSLRLPVFAGTSESVLQRGVGHMQGTSLPVGGLSTHSVLTAHRGLPTAKLFTDLNKLEIGHRIFIHYLGRTLAYEVDRIQVIEPSDFDPLRVVEKKDYLTLLTCTPYMINSHRLIVRAHRISYTEEVRVEAKKEKKVYEEEKKSLWFVGWILLLLVSLNVIRWYYWDRKKEEDDEILAED